jgi:hypothetical protein
MKTIHAAIFLAVGIFGCLDLELLDEMLPLDAGGEDLNGQGDDQGNGGDSEGAGDTDGSGGPPAQDPNDAVPPELLAPECVASEQAVDQICVAKGPISASLRFSTDEPASVTVASLEGLQSGVLSEEWSTAHHVVLAGIDSEIETLVSIGVKDVNENELVLEIPIIAKGGQPVAITEVLADPFGPEPDQEFVEVANLGDEPMDLSGWSIDDCQDSNGDLIPEGAVLAPGQLGVLVSPNYNLSEGQDPSPDPTALVVFLETSIGSNGLKNSEAESIELYDGQGILVSQYRGQAGAPVEGAGAIRTTAELPDGDPLAFAVDPNGTSTPGRAPTLP